MTTTGERVQLGLRANWQQFWLLVLINAFVGGMVHLPTNVYKIVLGVVLILGLGAGFMFAVPIGLFALYIPDALRPRAFGLNAAMWGVSAAIGPARRGLRIQPTEALRAE